MPIKLIVARNLAALRKQAGLTQGELAEKFNYSDKSISKWEHGDTLPDIEVLKELCDFYGVTLDYLVTDDPKAQESLVKHKERTANKFVIAILSVMVVWLVAIFVYVLGHVSMGEAAWVPKGWICFLYAFPASCVVLLVFNSIWGKSLWRAILIISLVWSLLTAIYLSLGLFMADGGGWNLWALFLIGVPCTIAAILWNHIIVRPHPKA